MQGQANGEVAVKFGFDQGGDLQIEAYYLPKNGVSFTSDELNTAYLQASEECKTLRQDKEASQLLQEFVTQVRGQEEKNVERVFTFDGHLPTVLGLTSRSRRERDPLGLTKQQYMSLIKRNLVINVRRMAGKIIIEGPKRQEKSSQ
jgi:hypothetical protein